VWHDGEDLFYVMFEKDGEGRNRDVRVDTFPVASGAQLFGIQRLSHLYKPCRPAAWPLSLEQAMPCARKSLPALAQRLFQSC
jgi:hypothetical protein